MPVEMDTLAMLNFARHLAREIGADSGMRLPLTPIGAGYQAVESDASRERRLVDRVA